MPVPYSASSSSSSTTNSTTTNKWGPYSTPGDFGANMVVILVIMFCILVLILAVNALVRYLLLAARASSGPRPEGDLEKGGNSSLPAGAEVGPTLIFSASTTELAGEAAAECSICLAEFTSGDRIHVLPTCSHGFHVGCIEKWLVAKKSCPTCRASCHVEGLNN